MRRMGSRNFILTMCGILIVMILGLTIAHTAFNTILSVSNDNKNDSLNVLYFDSESNLLGDALIINSPKISGTVISDLEVQLKNPGDKVRYSIRFCNDGEESIIYSGMNKGNIFCTNTSNNKIDSNFCSKIVLDGYILNRGKIVDSEVEVEPRSCFNFIFSVEYPDTETYVGAEFIEVSGISYSLIFDKK